MMHGKAEITGEVRAEALYLYDTRPEIIEGALMRLPSDIPRDRAEELARQIAMSAALAVAAGIPTEVNEMLFTEVKEWHEQLDDLLVIHARYAPGAPE